MMRYVSDGPVPVSVAVETPRSRERGGSHTTTACSKIGDARLQILAEDQADAFGHITDMDTMRRIGDAAVLANWQNLADAPVEEIHLDDLKIPDELPDRDPESLPDYQNKSLRRSKSINRCPRSQRKGQTTASDCKAKSNRDSKGRFTKQDRVNGSNRRS